MKDLFDLAKSLGLRVTVIKDEEGNEAVMLEVEQAKEVV